MQSYKEKNLSKKNKYKTNTNQNKYKIISKNLFLNRILPKYSYFKNISNDTINKLISTDNMGINYDSTLVFSHYNSRKDLNSFSHQNKFFPNSVGYKSNKKIFFDTNKILNDNNNINDNITDNKNKNKKNNNNKNLHNKYFSNLKIHHNKSDYFKKTLTHKNTKITNDQSTQTIKSGDYLNLKIKNFKKKINFNLNNTNQNNYPLSEIRNFKRSSLIDRLMFKMIKPDECIEEYDNNNIEYKYVKFKKQLKKEKNKVDKIILKLQLEQRKADEEIKKYNPTLLVRQYHLRTQYDIENNNNVNINKNNNENEVL
jgi:hypothetical protein